MLDAELAVDPLGLPDDGAGGWLRNVRDCTNRTAGSRATRSGLIDEDADDRREVSGRDIVILWLGFYVAESRNFRCKEGRARKKASTVGR